MSSLPADDIAIPGEPIRIVRDFHEEVVEDAARQVSRDLVELSVGYGLILLALWTPQPLQRWLDWIALAWVVGVTASDFDGWRVNGLSAHGFLRSFWIATAAAAAALIAMAVAVRLGTLHGPRYTVPFIHRYWAYAIWAFAQEFLLLDFFLRRLVRVLKSKAGAVVVTAGLFGLAHVPNPVLMPLTLIWAPIACVVFLRYGNLYTLGIAHAILGICIAVTVPGQTDHNMRVGIGYLEYHSRHVMHHRSHRPQTVSTMACVIAEAPTRRS